MLMNSKSDNLFSSKTDPVPEVRRDLDIIPVQDDGNSYLCFHDVRGYASPDIALHPQTGPLLSLIDGSKSIRDLSSMLGEQVNTEQLVNFVQLLDKHRLLHSEFFKLYAEKIEKEYEASNIHQALTAGVSYPADADKLTHYLDKAFSTFGGKDVKNRGGNKIALYAPHIDPKVGIESYVKAFSTIRKIRPERVVILATSHYSTFYPETYFNKPFVVSNKNFEMPLGEIRADKKVIEKLLDEGSEAGITSNDRAHRIEHSIELHLLFLSYLWDHDFQIVPILVGGLDDLFYMEKGYRGKQVELFGKLLNKHFAGDGETFFLISGDQAHIGKKFGDEKPARKLFNEVKSFDRLFMKYAEEGAEEHILRLMKEKYDPYRICGFPPLYSFLKSMSDIDIKGQILDYDLWDEHEKESAVSYGSILYEKVPAINK